MNTNNTIFNTQAFKSVIMNIFGVDETAIESVITKLNEEVYTLYVPVAPKLNVATLKEQGMKKPKPAKRAQTFYNEMRRKDLKAQGKIYTGLTPQFKDEYNALDEESKAEFIDLETIEKKRYSAQVLSCVIIKVSDDEVDEIFNDKYEIEEPTVKPKAEVIVKVIEPKSERSGLAKPTAKPTAKPKLIEYCKELQKNQLLTFAIRQYIKKQLNPASGSLQSNSFDIDTIIKICEKYSDEDPRIKEILLDLTQSKGTDKSPTPKTVSN
jgi:hypothetical protein